MDMGDYSSRRRLSIGLAAAIAACAFAASLAVGASGSTTKATLSEKSTAGLGLVLVGSTGKTVYRFTMDKSGKSNCSGGCASLWPPVLIAKGTKPVAGEGVTQSKLGTIKRSNGSVQVTYAGFPLYFYKGDTKVGQANGQGVESVWYAVASSGALVKTKVSSTASSSSTGSASSTSSSSPTSSAGASGSSGSVSSGGGSSSPAPYDY
jgi:predicted lipoprotein with Yx(FWY)xxD motif